MPCNCGGASAANPSERQHISEARRKVYAEAQQRAAQARALRSLQQQQARKAATARRTSNS